MTLDLKINFPNLSEHQLTQLRSLLPFYQEWNEKINLISRKDMEHFILHHVIHSLSLIKFMTFKPDTDILDLGTGGGFPGIPLAIVFPEVKFHLIDGTGKKIKVVKEAITHLQLANVTAEHIRIEDVTSTYDFVTARAVTNLADLIRLARPRIKSKNINARPNGLIAYKGHPLKDEGVAVRKKPHEIFMIEKKINDPYFEGKCIVYVPMY